MNHTLTDPEAQFLQLAARIRRLAAALEQRGVEPKMLDECLCRNNVDTCSYCEGGLRNPVCSIHATLTERCLKCWGTGTVVPSEEVCFWRLTLAVLAIPQFIEIERFVDGGYSVVFPQQSGVDRPISIGGDGTNPLEALVAAVEAALGLEVQE